MIQFDLLNSLMDSVISLDGQRDSVISRATGVRGRVLLL